VYHAPEILAPSSCWRVRRKLCIADVLEIDRLHAAGIANVKIAKQLHVVEKTVISVVYRRSWKHVPGGAQFPTDGMPTTNAMCVLDFDKFEEWRKTPGCPWPSRL
jgi:hypothetical protein